MPKYTFSPPQVMLLRLGAFLFVLWLMLFLALFYWLNRPVSYNIQFVQFTVHPIVNKVSREVGLIYGEVLNQPNGFTEMNWQGNTVVVFGQSEVSFSSEEVKVLKGSIFINPKAEYTIITPQDKKYNLTQTGLYLAQSNQFIVTTAAGNIKLGTILQLEGTSPTIKNVDKESILQMDTFGDLLNYWLKTDSTPSEWQDHSAPKLNLDFAQPLSVSSPQFTFSGNISDVNGQVFINNQEINVSSNGKFTKEFTLAVGTNRFSVQTKDQQGNAETTEVTINLKSVASTTCELSSKNNEYLLCLINEERQANALNKVVLNANLSSLANEHSQYMEANKQLSHDNFDIRCADNACQAEIVGTNSTSDLKDLLEKWLKSSTDLVQIQGDFQQIGIGISGEYVTVIFK